MVQVFTEATFLSAMPFIFAKFDGVLGMGYPNMAIDGITPVFDHIMSQHVLKEEVFSVYYSRYASVIIIVFIIVILCEIHQTEEETGYKLMKQL